MVHSEHTLKGSVGSKLLANGAGKGHWRSNSQNSK